MEEKGSGPPGWKYIKFFFHNFKLSCHVQRGDNFQIKYDFKRTLIMLSAGNFTAQLMGQAGTITKLSGLQLPLNYAPLKLVTILGWYARQKFVGAETLQVWQLKQSADTISTSYKIPTLAEANKLSC